MSFYFLKIVFKLLIHIYFRRIQVKGLKNFPRNRPVIIASNHPNAFMDAIILSLFFPGRIYSLARSDVFNSVFKRIILKYFKIMPIYRLQDGADQLYKNTEVFEKCYSLLNQNATVLIFPEGFCIQERRLRKLKKGLARIAFGSEEITDFNLGLCILPVGINYTKPAEHGGEVFLNIAPPIEISDYRDHYKQDKTKAINRLTNDLESEMAGLIVVIEDFRDDELVENMESILENKTSLFKTGEFNQPENKFRLSRRITQGLSLLKQNNAAFEELKQKINFFFSTIKREGFQHEVLNEDLIQKSKTRLLGLKYILLLITCPVFFIGYLLNYLPYRLPYLLSKKIVKNNVEFFSSLNFTLGVIIFTTYYFILAAIAGVFIPIAYVLLLLTGGPLAGKFALYYRSIYQEVVAINKMKNKPDLIKKLWKDKQEILLNVNSLILKKKNTSNFSPC